MPATTLEYTEPNLGGVHGIPYADKAAQRRNKATWNCPCDACAPLSK